MTQIVVVNVSQTVAPTPSQLQKTGAIISQGGTTLAPGSYSLLTQLASLTPLFSASLALSSLVWSAAGGGTVTATTSAPHGMTTGDQFLTTIAGTTPAGYSGTYPAFVTGASTFVFPLTTSPGTITTPGTYTPRMVAELTAGATTFFAQGAQQGVYVLELGAGEPAAGVNALSAFITANPSTFYSYLVPRSWDGNAAYLALLAQFEGLSAKTYFFTTTTLATWQNYTDLLKCVVAMVESPETGVWPANALSSLTWAATNGGQATGSTTTAHGVSVGETFTLSGSAPAGWNGTFLALPGTTASTLIWALPTNPGSETLLGQLQASVYANPGIPPTEVSNASDWWVSLNYNPSSTNKVTPFEYSFLYDVTPYPLPGNGALLATLQAANINYVATGYEGGISDAMLVPGNTLDGNPFNYWYSVDWMQINLDLNLANAVINGSNNPINPLYYDQPGINRLQQVAAQTAASAVTFGLATGTVTLTALTGPQLAAALDAGQFDGMIVVNAVPLIPYLTASPGDYKIGKYAGLSVIYTPARGFSQIIVNLNVTNFVVP